MRAAVGAGHDADTSAHWYGCAAWPAQVWMPREAVEAKLQEIRQVADQCKQDFKQGKIDSKDDSKGKVLTPEKAKKIIEKMKEPLMSMRAAPGLCTGISGWQRTEAVRVSCLWL